MDLSIAHHNMIQQQIRTWDVLDPSLLDVFKKVPLDLFVSPAFKNVAFSDTFIPIGQNQVTLPPKFIGRMLQALDLSHDAHVLEIGTGTGYLTCLLSHLVATVMTIEIIPELAQKASQHFQNLNLHNITSKVGDGTQGCSEGAPYDAIIFTGSLALLPNIIIEQLKSTGKIFAVLGNSPAMSAVLLQKEPKGHFNKQFLFETLVPPLISSLSPQRFKI